jgi:lysozyme
VAALSGRIPKPLQAALAAMLASIGAGGGVYLAEQERTSQLQTEYLRTVAADTSTSDAIKLAMVLGSYYESSFRHIGTPYVDRLGKGQPLTVCNGITGAGVVAGRYYTPADCYRLEVGRYKEAEAFLAKSVPTYSAATVLQQATFLDFVHNVGSAGFSNSTMRRKLLVGDVVGACRENSKWVYGTINGAKVALPGLVIRRNANSDLCDGTERIEGMVFDG